MKIILERDGVEALTLRGAAREAGVTHGSPAHHFGDLSGLLSELAATGFDRFHERLRLEGSGRPASPGARGGTLPRLCRVRTRQPRAVPADVPLRAAGLVRPALATAGAGAFALLMEQAGKGTSANPATAYLATVMARWSLAHGLAMLLIDGRLEAITEKVSGIDVETLVEAVLTGGLL